ncbi:MAG: IS66 family transposase [Acidimicrobiales bacterium]
MKRKTIEDAIETLQADVASIADPKTKTILSGLLNLVETLYSENESLREENQQLKDKINRLKGEQGKPDIKGRHKKDTSDHSSEKERQAGKGDKENNNKKRRRREAKLPKVAIDREQICPIDKNDLPEDILFKGYADVVIQDIKITTDNVKYRREVYYSPSLETSFFGQLPVDVAGKGEFGVGIRSLIPLLKSECNLSESCILSFFQNFGIEISSTYISNQWTKGATDFHREKTDIIAAGLASATYQQMDDTGARVSGENHYTQILCNPFYSAYFTVPHKDRLTVLDVLRNFAPRQYLYNLPAISLLEDFHLSKKMRMAVDQQLDKDTFFDEGPFNCLLDGIRLGPQQRTRVEEACAIAAYREQATIPVVDILMCDDAPQFKLLTQHIALCWIHDGRHYKKLRPVAPQHKKALEDFLTQYWLFYHQLKTYKEAPNNQQAFILHQEFDTLFSTKTDYEQLDERIAKTRAKRDALLLVLDHPELPLHNNASELAARVQARERDVSLHTMSKAGTEAKDTFMTISQTAKKLGVRTYEYIRDRVSGELKLPSLAQLIREKSLACEAVNESAP